MLYSAELHHRQQLLSSGKRSKQNHTNNIQTGMHSLTPVISNLFVQRPIEVSILQEKIL